MELLVAVLIPLLRVLIPLLFDELKPKNNVADRQSELRDKLRATVKRTWLLFFVIFFFAGCGNNRTVYVPDGTPVKLRETVKNVKVWIKVNGNTETGVIDLPEGWYCLPLEN